MNNTNMHKILAAVLISLLFGSFSVYTQAKTDTAGTALTLNTHHSFEMAKFRVLVGKEDLEHGKVILDCEDIGCSTMEGIYDPDTVVYLPDGKVGSTPQLLNYSDRNADISIRKSDKHVRRIRLYK